MNISRMNKTMQDLHDQIRDLKLYETELKAMISKKMVLEEQNNDMKVKLMDNFIGNQKTEINAKEKEIEERGVFVKLQTLQD